MSRKIKIDIQRCRRDNYVSYFDDRERFKSLSVELQDVYRKLASRLPMPRLNVYGCSDLSYDEERALIMLAVHSGVDVNFLNPWLVSEEGWQNFQDQWADLPEPMEVGIPVSLCTTHEVVHIVHRDGQKAALLSGEIANM